MGPRLKSELRLLYIDRGGMALWLEQLLVKQEDLGLIPAQTKWCFFSDIRRLEKIDPDTIQLCDLANPCT